MFQIQEDAPAYKQYMGMIEGMRGFLMAEYPQLKDGLTLLYENYMRDSSWCLAHSQHYKKNGEFTFIKSYGMSKQLANVSLFWWEVYKLLEGVQLNFMTQESQLYSPPIRRMVDP